MEKFKFFSLLNLRVSEYLNLVRFLKQKDQAGKYFEISAPLEEKVIKAIIGKKREELKNLAVHLLPDCEAVTLKINLDVDDNDLITEFSRFMANGYKL